MLKEICCSIDHASACWPDLARLARIDSLADAMRQWLWLYPIVEIIHILGLVVLVGAVALFDFKLLGFSPTCRFRDWRAMFFPRHN